MNDKFDDLIDKLQNVTPPDDLSDRVLSAVRRDHRHARTLAGLLYAALSLTAPALLLSIRLLVSDVSASPLADLLDLAITDWRHVQVSLGSWFLAVFEALPILSLALTLGALLILMVVIDRIIAKNSVKNSYIKEVI